MLSRQRLYRYNSHMTTSELCPVLSGNATPADAIAFLRSATKYVGPCFHPDTPARNYTVADTREPLLTDAERPRWDADIDRCFELLDDGRRDPYTVASKVQWRLLGFPPRS